METIQLGFNQKDALLKREIAASEQSRKLPRIPADYYFISDAHFQTL